MAGAGEGAALERDPDRDDIHLWAEQQRRAAAERFLNLPEDVREFLIDLRSEDVATLREVIRSWRAAATVGTFGRRLLIWAVGVVAAVVAFWDNLGKIALWLRGH